MKTALALVAVVSLLTGNTFAGPELAVKQHAKDLNTQNNVRQGITPATQSAPAAPAAPAPSPALAKLQTDLAALKVGSEATAEQKQQIAQDLLAVAQGTKPSVGATAKLAEDLSVALADKPLSSANRARFARDLDAVFNPGKYPQAKLDGIFNDIQIALQDNGLSRGKAAAVTDDVKAISAELHK